MIIKYHHFITGSWATFDTVLLGNKTPKSLESGIPIMEILVQCIFCICPRLRIFLTLSLTILISSMSIINSFLTAAANY